MIDSRLRNRIKFNMMRNKSAVSARIAVVGVLVATLVLTSYLAVRNDYYGLGRRAADSTAKVPADFNSVLTHLFYFPRESEQYVGKRYFGTKGNATAGDRKAMKVWSGPLDCNSSVERQVVYQYYFGWDDQPGKVQEWEAWRRGESNSLVANRWGGPVANAVSPYWQCGWMGAYEPLKVQVSPVKYSCGTGQPVAGHLWPVLAREQSLAVQKVTNNRADCTPVASDSTKFEYVAVAYREDYGSANSDVRKQKCYDAVHPVWGKSQNPYNICVDAPYVGRFDQRYAAWANEKWNYGCEPLVYVWGYPESGPTNKAFRNGELRWMDYAKFSEGSAYYPHDNENFWQSGCGRVWRGELGETKGGWVYSGVYQVGMKFWEDMGGNASPVEVSRFSPNPTPTPIVTSGAWCEKTLGFSGEEWCNVGTTCDTGWVGGPAVSVACPAGQKMKNTGTYYSRWDGMKKFVGKTECVSASSCN